ncbi:unnamed protein product [Owenia fusiformis]|uniref:Fibrocystin-L n=1 Tax=Owenia fusiformis TaxID=6347 RepID=A0A8S4P3U6_OWEFU|nr:unnamed protein product [Owenia fusiformis]
MTFHRICLGWVRILILTASLLFNYIVVANEDLEPFVDKVEPHVGSAGGESLITIYGGVFAKNQFNFNPGEEHLGNSVTLVSDKQAYPCKVHKDGCTETRIQCYTPQLEPGHYFVRVAIDGVKISDSKLCRGDVNGYRCLFEVRRHNFSPTISSVSPRSGPPGTVVTMRGKLFTDRYGSDKEAGSNGNTADIRRVFFGGQKCELKMEDPVTKELTDEMYNLSLDFVDRNDDGITDSNMGSMTCKLQGSYVGSINGSFIVSSPYGGSLASLEALRVTSNDKISMFQTYAEVIGVSPSSGSIAGGTVITITGKNFDDTNAPPYVDIAGSLCEVLSQTDTEIVCVTGLQPSAFSLYPGNRGIKKELWKNTNIHFDDLASVSSFTDTNPTDEYTIEWLDEARFFEDELDSFVTRMRGFFVPSIDSDFKFFLKSDDSSRLYLSTSENPSDKVEIAYATRQWNWYDREESQQSQRVSLQGGQKYYIEVLQQEHAAQARVQVAAMMYTTRFTGQQSGDVIAEKQIVMTNSVALQEQQSIELQNWAPKTSVSEVQKVTVGALQGVIRLGMDGVYTVPIDIGQPNAGDMMMIQLNRLITISPDGTSVSVNVGTSTMEFTITFNSERGDLPLLTYRTTGGISITVTEVMKGQSSLEKFQLELFGVPSALVTVGASAGMVADALTTLNSLRCPDYIVKPSRKFYFQDYEGDERVLGERSTENPFCGKTVVQSPHIIFQDYKSPFELSSGVKYLCFAYRGLLHNAVLIDIDYMENSSPLSKTVRIEHEFYAEEDIDFKSWKYTCLDMLSPLQIAEPDGSQFKGTRLRVFTDIGKNYWLDAVFIGSKPTVPVTPETGECLDCRYVNDQILRPPLPNGNRIERLDVTKSDNMYTLSITGEDVIYNAPLIRIRGGEVEAGGYAPGSGGATYGASGWGAAKAVVTRVSTATAPIAGTFELSFKGQTVTIPANATAEDFHAIFETMPTSGLVNVERTGTGTAYNWTVTFLTNTGDQELIQVNGNGLVGNEPNVQVITEKDGGVFLDPIQGDWLRTAHTTPQVSVKINNIPTACTGDCSFEYSEAATPTVTASTPSQGPANTDLTITGTGFHTTADQNTVLIGGAICDVTSATSTEIHCTTGNAAAGSADIIVRVIGKGNAEHNGGPFQFTYEAAVTALTPTTGSIAGGTFITLTISSLRDDALVSVGGNDCPVSTRTATTITCTTPTGDSAGEVQVEVTQGGVTLTSPIAFNYDSSLTATITSFSANTGSVTGGETIDIVGTQFGTGNDHVVTVGGVEATVVSSSDTQISVTLPPLPPGSHPIDVTVGTYGYADKSSVTNTDILVSFEVNNVSPLIGSMIGGTVLTLTGQGFGSAGANNIQVGRTSCTILSETNSKIVCKIDETATTHVVTNEGIHPVFGPDYAWLPHNLAIKTGDIVEWRWHAPSWVSNIGFSVQQTPNITAKEYDGTGFTSGPNTTPNGSFRHRFNSEGVYNYWSNYIDPEEENFIRGVITVTERQSHLETIRLTVNNFEAIYTPGGAPPAPGSCLPVTASVSGCTEEDVVSTNSDLFEFTFSQCSTPSISSISPNSGTSETDITITGEGFGPEICQNEVKIGAQDCVVSSSSETEIMCRLDPNGVHEVGTSYPVTVRVNNRGTAKNYIVIDENRSYTLLPMVSNVTPYTGSLSGGTTLTISGSGFTQGHTGGLTVNINGVTCKVESVSYTQVECTTISSGATTGHDVVVNVGPYASKCEGVCVFSYSEAATPTFIDVTPLATSISSTDITITGSKFGTDSVDVTVKIGTQDCSVTSVTDTSIACTIGYITVGPQQVNVIIKDKGQAWYSDPVYINSEAVVDTVSPSEGSINGGTVLNILGNGFDAESTKVTLDGVECTLQTVTLSQITCTTGPHVDGAVKVAVKSNDIDYPEIDFTYSTGITPVVTSIDPVTGTTGDQVTITGNGFSNIANDVTIQLGGSPCTIVSVTVNALVCDLGFSSAGEKALSVLVDGVGYATSDITFIYTLSLTSVSPSSGSFGGGQILTLTGTGFDPNNVEVMICDLACAVDVSSSTTTSLLIETPTNNGSGTQACDIVVSSGTSSATQSDGYTYSDTLTPAVTAVSPARGGTGGGVLIDIIGTGFGTTVGDISVTIAGSACTVSTVTDNLVQCTTSEHSPAVKAKVRVVVGTNGIATQDGADFWYIDVYSSNFTWGGLPPPVAGDFVVVPKEQVLLVDIDTPILAFLLIQGGHVMFDDERDIHLQAENILITDGGRFSIGTESAPYQHDAVITLHGHLRSPELPIYGAKTIGVRNGTLEFYGRPKVNTWTHLASTGAAGSTTITVQDNIQDWDIGDEIVIATTGNRNSQKETEKKVIVSISGNTITLDSPLEYEHLGVTETFEDGTTQLDLRAEVGLLTRNVKVKGSKHMDWSKPIPACKDGFNLGEFATQTCFQGRFGEEMGSDEFGAQIMIHAPAKDLNIAHAHLSYVEITHAGQAFRLGRYPVHFHLNGEQSGSYVKGCAIHETFNRAINIHGTNNVHLEKNVIYNIKGGAVFLEDGIETGNLIENNLVVFCRQSTSLLNDDNTPAAFWVTNPNNTYIGNTAAGGTHVGFWYRMHKHPDGPSYDESVCPQHAPLGIFRGNKAHSVGWNGLWIFQEYYPTVDGACDSTQSQAAIFRDFTAWNCKKGAEAASVGAVQFDNFLMVNHLESGIEYKLLNKNPINSQNGARVTNSVIIGSSSFYALGKTCSDRGITLPFSKGFVVENAKFINFEAECSALDVTKVAGVCSFGCGGYEYLTSGLTFHNTPNKNKVNFEWEHVAVIHDLDGSLTGQQPGSRLTTTTGLLPRDQCLTTDIGLGVGASVCNPATKFIRFAFNRPSPISLEAKDVKITNEYGSTTIPYLKKRLTHKFGWMTTLASGYTYNIEFLDVTQVTNISYAGRFSGLENDEYVIIRHHFTQAPQTFKVGPSRTLTEGTPDELTYEDNVVYDHHFNATNNDFTYLVSGKTDSPGPENYGSDYDVSLKVSRCQTSSCVGTLVANNDPPATERPEVFQLWSDVAYWADASDSSTPELPSDDTDVVVKPDTWLVADVPLPKINKLYIYGTLELDPSLDFDIHADLIFITGRLIVGWPDEPFPRLCTITLHGNHNTENFYQGAQWYNGPNIGSKAIGVFGGLDLHGLTQETSWTTLADTGRQGDNTITLATAVDWAVQNDIVIASTGYNAWETETFRIVGISDDGLTLTLNDTLTYTHRGVAETYGSYEVTMAAEVGLLNRNIKIIGAEYENIEDESFGARVLVGTFNKESQAFTGYARLNNVEFIRTGQEGWTEAYDPRFSLAFLNTGEVSPNRPSFVNSCTFHHGFSSAIGVFGTDGLVVSDNVIYHTVGAGMKIGDSFGNELRGNFLALLIWPGSYQERYEPFNFIWDGSIEVFQSQDVILEGNHVTGSERVGFHIKGEECTGGNASWSGNVAHSSLIGVYMNGERLSKTLKECVKVSGFSSWMNYDYGVYIQQDAVEVRISDLQLIDNTLGLFMMNVNPSSLSHIAVDKKFHFTNSLIVGTSAASDCDVSVNSDNANIRLSSLARTSNTPTGGRVGHVWPTFASGHNRAPEKKFNGLITYPALYGEAIIDGITYANFGVNKCGTRDVAIMTNENNPDAMHPITISNTERINVDDDSLVYIQRPSLDHIDPTNCVDMECDAKKKCLIRDVDGTFLGSTSGTVIPRSEFAWDKEPERGIGNYRIPKVALTDLQGSRLAVEDVFPSKGIIRDSSCVYNPVWQAYECHGLDHKMMVIESLDRDTELRRLSPVAIIGDRHIDLINGPEDHGWCFGYTCQKRISTFYSIVASGKHFDVYFTGTSPQNLRLHLLNAYDNEAVRLSIYYKVPYRLDVYVDGTYRPPLNKDVNADGDEILKAPTYEGEFYPDISDGEAGDNFVNREWRQLYVLIRGNTPVTIRQAPVLRVTFNAPAQSIDDFFKTNLISNLVQLLGIDPSKIRIMNVVSASSRRKRMVNVRKRDTEYDLITLEIGTEPTEDADETNTENDSDEIASAAAKLIDCTQLGTLENELGISIDDVIIYEPVPNVNDSSWQEFESNEVAGTGVYYVQADAMHIATSPEPRYESVPFITQPEFQMLSPIGEVLPVVGSYQIPWQVTATLVLTDTSDERATLVGMTTASFLNGKATFDDIGVSHSGTYKIYYEITYPTGAAHLNYMSEEFYVPLQPIDARVNVTGEVLSGNDMEVSVELIDGFTMLKHGEIDWKGHTWSATVTLLNSDEVFGTLVVTDPLATFDVNSGIAVISGRIIDVEEPTRVFLDIHVISEPSDYDFTVISPHVDVMPVGYQPISEDTRKKIKLLFDADYDSIVAGREELFIATVYNHFMPKYYEKTSLTGWTTRKGSIIVEFNAQGTEDDITSVLYDIYDEVDSGLEISFNGSFIEARREMFVDGVEYYGRSGSQVATSALSTDELIGVITACVLSLAVVVIVVVILVMKNKAKDSKITPRGDHGDMFPSMCRQPSTITILDSKFVDSKAGCRKEQHGDFTSEGQHGDFTSEGQQDDFTSIGRQPSVVSIHHK